MFALPEPRGPQAGLSGQPHPVKTERHDPVRMEHHTNTGVRAVRTYEERPHGLFVARDFDRHPRVRHWQAHLLPDLDLVVCRYDFHGPREHDYYIDVAQVSREDGLWAVRDLYLDVVVHDGLGAEILDTDELLAARAADLIGEADLHRAVTVAHRTLSGLAHASYRLDDWLGAQGLRLDWCMPAETGVAGPLVEC
ncbi:DUF402 domain-containing protein [uncultured Deinococcus sp.]|uniref:DUF402 domain-containing protein n=2 Tax=uncultured Deinococcus sp. TaxID=158789 RepID=UPI0025893C35|nr:DUF402 domain-containing protein [uncultured Deinococcus sp.]